MAGSASDATQVLAYSRKYRQVGGLVRLEDHTMSKDTIVLCVNVMWVCGEAKTHLRKFLTLLKLL